MQNQKSKGAAWQRRREEYLRAAGRYDDLINEGYLPPNTVERWSVIAGGRTGRALPAIGSGNQILPGEAAELDNLAAHAQLGGDAVAQHTAMGTSENILKIGHGDAFSSPGISV
jgi:hypothetical protein